MSLTQVPGKPDPFHRPEDLCRDIRAFLEQSQEYVEAEKVKRVQGLIQATLATNLAALAVGLGPVLKGFILCKKAELCRDGHWVFYKVITAFPVTEIDAPIYCDACFIFANVRRGKHTLTTVVSQSGHSSQSSSETSRDFDGQGDFVIKTRYGLAPTSPGNTLFHLSLDRISLGLYSVPALDTTSISSFDEFRSASLPAEVEAGLSMEIQSVTEINLAENRAVATSSLSGESQQHFSWLHFGDLHWGCEKQDWMWPSVRSLLLEDLDKLKSLVGHFDAIFFTGDLVNLGLKVEYEQVVSEFFTPLRILLGASTRLVATGMFF